MSFIRILIFILLCSPVFGQYKPKVFEFGPKIGLNVNGIATLDTITFKKKLSLLYQAGVFTRFNFGKVSLQPEFIYQVKGATFTSPANAKYNFKYLSTPILLGFTPFKGIYFETGPEFSWALNSGKQKGNLTIYGPDAPTDNSWVIGTRINMLDMFSLMSLNIRYTQGLNNVMPETKSGITPVDFRNRSIQVSVTYAFSEYYRWKRKLDLKKTK